MTPLTSSGPDSSGPDSSGPDAGTSQYVLRPRPPIRAFLIAAVLALVGAAVLVVSLTVRWPLAATLVAGVVLLAGLVLLVLALVSLRSLAMKVSFDADGYRIKGPDIDVTGQWSNVTKVVQADDGARLIFHHGEVRRTHLWCPGGGADPQMHALTAEVSRRLDADRGYSDLI